MKEILLLALLLFISFTSKLAYSSDRVMATIIEIEFFTDMLEQYKKDVGRYPENEQGLKVLYIRPENVDNWKGPYINKSASLDRWGNAYIYYFPSRYGDKPYDLFSIGKNGMNDLGEKDDITNWSKPDFGYYYSSSKPILTVAILFLLISIVIVVIYTSKRKANRGK